MMGVSQSGSTNGTGKAEGCLMPETNMTGKRFCSLDVCQGLDENLGSGLKAEGRKCLHTDGKQVFEQKTDSG